LISCLILNGSIVDGHHWIDIYVVPHLQHVNRILKYRIVNFWTSLSVQ
jgi:hypothetical protein